MVVVDDSIVDFDNFRRRLQERTGAKTLPHAIAVASAEIRVPMLYATLIAVIAVAPLLIIQGLSAAFFQPLAWSYITAIVVSFIVATTVTPALALLLIPPDTASQSIGSKFMHGLRQRYTRLVGWVVRTPIVAQILVAGGIVVGGLIWFHQEHTLIPSFKETDVFVELQAPAGASLQAVSHSTEALVHDLRAIPGVRNAAAQIGRALLSREMADVSSATVWVSLDPNAEYGATLADVRKAVDAHPDVSGEVQTFLSKRMREGLTGEDKAISIRIYGQDLNILRSKANEIKQVLKTVEGVTDPEVEPQMEQQAIDVEVNLDKARAHGLKPGDVRRAASALIGGITVGSLFQEQKVFDVVVWGRPGIRKDVDDIRNLLIDTDSGTQVRLADVARVDIVNTPSVIHRQGASRRIDVEADVSGRSVAAVTEEIKRRINEGAFPFEYHAEVLGEHMVRQAALRSLYGYLLAAAIGAVLLLQATFNSWRLTALAIIGVPVATLGGFVAAYLTSETFSLGCILGLFAVLTLSLRNMMMQIRHFQDLELQGPEHGTNVILRGAGDRLGPVLASAVSIALIVLPFAALGDIAGLEILHPAAVVILGGLITSTALTLFVIPSLYPHFIAKAEPAPPPLAPEVA
jgi:Cu/Ag efflux pump CusA